MCFTRRARQFVGWIACCAILLGLAAPTITHALPSGAAGQWVTVCTALGMKSFKLDAAGQLDEQAGAPAGAPTGEMGSMGTHCAFCTGSTPVLGLPPAPQAEMAAPEGFAARPALFWAAPRLAAIWATAQPRAPPLFA